MKRVVNVLAISLVAVFLFLSTAVTVCALCLEPYARLQMDMSLLRVEDWGEPAVLYAGDGDTRISRCPKDYRRVGEVLATEGKYIYTPYEEMPTDLIHAFVAIEDKHFFEHQGVDVIRTVRAAFNYLKDGRTMGGRTFGGSTITQQLVKNLTERDEYTPERKLAEIFLALDMERQADKTEILTCYLNIINLANGCRGVGAAATYYFDRSVSDLTLAECASLAAITNNPSVYDPIRNPENNRARRNLILSEMLSQGYITQEAYDTAAADDIKLHLQTRPSNTTVGVSSWYADMVATDVIRDLQTRLGYTYAQASRAVFGGGLTIYTAMDPAIQSILDNYYADVNNFPVGINGRPQSSMMILDPHTGDILGVAGAVGEKKGNRVQNYATDTRRPAGSTIKPLSVYAPALEEGRIIWSTVYEDEPIKTNSGKLWPRNADGLYRGRVSVSTAMAHSLNTVAVRMVEEAGLPKTFTFLHDRLHMTGLRAADDSGLHDMTLASLALGQQSIGVSVRELTAAYTIFDRGVYHAPVSYHQVVDKEGRVLLENRPRGEVVLSEANACVMTQLLRRVVTDGSAADLTIEKALGIQAAGKTGTSQNNCDRWFVGYTPRLLGGVWMGYDYPSALKGMDGNPCLGVWDEVIQACEQVYEGVPRETTFAIHPDVIRLSFCRASGQLPLSTCGQKPWKHFLEEGWFVRGAEPHGFCEAHQTEHEDGRMAEDG